MANEEISKGFNTQTIEYVPSEFINYPFRKIKVRDLSISQVSNLSVMGGDVDLNKLIEIYSPCMLNVSQDEVEQLMYIDFIPLLHFINHLSFGTYDNSFTYKKCEKCGKSHSVNYNLYDINFSKSSKSFDDNLLKIEPWTVCIEPFTVKKMARILELFLEDNPLAFTASCIKAVYNSDGKELEQPNNLLDKMEWVSQFPSRFRTLVEIAISERHPNTLPLSYKFNCGHVLEFIPDMTLKGLPSFTSIKGA